MNLRYSHFSCFIFSFHSGIEGDTDDCIIIPNSGKLY